VDETWEEISQEEATPKELVNKHKEMIRNA
jgi:hypothetical protein